MNYYAILAYDPETGLLTWAVGRPGVSAGAVAGSLSRYGYVCINVGRKQIRAHRLAWFFTHGQWPDGEIDHINGVRSDNRMVNLRVVDRSGNSQNRWRPMSNNRSGHLGVCWVPHARGWKAQITANKKTHFLGYHDSAEAAHAVYMEAKARLHIGGGSH